MIWDVFTLMWRNCDGPENVLLLFLVTYHAHVISQRMIYFQQYQCHDDVIIWRQFAHYWSSEGILPMDSIRNVQQCGALMFFWLLVNRLNEQSSCWSYKHFWASTVQLI